MTPTQKEITHMGDDNRCDTCYEQGKLQQFEKDKKDILEIIEKNKKISKEMMKRQSQYTEVHKWRIDGYNLIIEEIQALKQEETK